MNTSIPVNCSGSVPEVSRKRFAAAIAANGGSACLPNRDEVFLDTLAQLLGNTPKAITDIFGAEDNTRQVYSDRFLFELLQNARDAAARSPCEAPRVRIEIRPDALLVANDGAPFELGGYEAVTGISKSPKRGSVGNGPRLIGKKGIGFKSVLRVSQTPQIFANGGAGERFAVEFGSPRVRTLCEAALTGSIEALCAALSPAEAALTRTEIERIPLGSRSLLDRIGERGIDPATLLAQIPVMMFPLGMIDVPADVESLLGWRSTTVDPHFQTVIRLPLSPEQIEEVCTRVREDVLPEKTLFLGTLAYVEVIDHTGNALDRTIHAKWQTDQVPWTVTIKTTGISKSEDAPFKWRVFPREIDVVLPDGTNEKRGIQVAVPVDENDTVLRFDPHPLFNYYPLVDEGLVLPLLVHAEFEVDPGRTKLSADHKRLNSDLLKGILDTLVGPGGLLDAVTTGIINGRAQVPSLLVPVATERPLPLWFRNELLKTLLRCACIPDTAGGWALPAATRNHRELADLIDAVMGAWPSGGVTLPEASTRGHHRFGEVAQSLNLQRYALADLIRALEADLTRDWKDPAQFRMLYRLLHRLTAESDACGDALALFRVGSSEGSPLPLVPCAVESGELKILPLPRLRQSGGQNTEALNQARREVQVLHLTGVECTPSPPASMRLLFIHPAALDGDREMLRFVEDVLGVRAYETLAVLRRVDDVDVSPEDAQALARFLFAFLLHVGKERWSLFSAELKSDAPKPGRFYAGAPGDDDADTRAARAGLAKVHLLDANGGVHPADGLRFSVAWGAIHADLDRLDPPSAIPLASPDALADYLDIEGALCLLPSRPPVDDENPRAIHRSLARAFARLCGVWETAPLGHVVDLRAGVEPSTVIGMVAAAGSLLSAIPDVIWNQFGKQPSYRHQNTRIMRTWWLRDLATVAADAERAGPFLRLLARDWGELFGRLGRLELRCPSCKHGGYYHSEPMRNDDGSAPPSVLFWQLRQTPWYRARDAEIQALSSLWLVPDPPEGSALQSSPWRFLPHVREQSPDTLQVLSAMGVTWFGDAPVSRYIELLVDLRSQFIDDHAVSDGPARVAFVALHREVWARLQALVRAQAGLERFDEVPIGNSVADGSFFGRQPQHFTRRSWESLSSLPTLAEHDRSLVYIPTRESLIDRGTSSFARHLFRSEASFSCADERGRGLLQVLGALPFDLNVEPRIGGVQTDRTEAIQVSLAPFLPELAAVLGRLAPGGGNPVELEGHEFRKRLASLRSCRFVQCEDLRVVFSVRGRIGDDARPPIKSLEVGNGPGDVHLDEKGAVPRVLFDVAFKEDDPEAILAVLARPLAQVLATASFEDIFALLLRIPNEDDRVRFLEKRGIVDEDVNRARMIVGYQDQASWERRRMAIRALSQVIGRELPLPPTEPGPDPVGTWRNWQEENLSTTEGIARIAIEQADRLPEHLEDPTDNGPLALLDAAGINLSQLSEALKLEGLETVNIRVHADRLRDVRLRHWETAVTGLVRRGATTVESKTRVAGTLRPKDSWRTRLRVDSTELCADASALLALFNLPGLDATISREVYRANVAQALGLSVDAFVGYVHETFSDEERATRQSADFERLKRELRNVMVALRLPATDVRVEQVQRVADIWQREIVFPGLDQVQEAPFAAWIEGSGLRVDSRELLDRIVAGVGVAEIAELLGRSELTRMVVRIANVLDDARRKRLAGLRASFAQHRGVILTNRVEPSESIVAPILPAPTGNPDLPCKRSVRRGKVTEDEAERQSRGRLGTQGERIAFAWAVAPLVSKYTSDHASFLSVVRRLRDRLSDVAQLDVDLQHQFDSAVEILTIPDLEEEDLLDALQSLTHVSGDFASDAFGFDLLVWLSDTEGGAGEILCVEVKTSRANADGFHFSRNQHDVAAEQGRGFAVLRVIVQKGSRSGPKLRLLVDPVGLAAMTPPALVLTPEEFLAHEAKQES